MQTLTNWTPAPLALLTLGFVLGGSPVSPLGLEAIALEPWGSSISGLAHGQLPATPDPTSTNANDHPSDGHHPSDGPHSSDGPHHHSTLEIPAGQPVPTLQLVLHPDPVRGWNLELQTTHFRFAPELINQANQPNTGHAHLYINGEKGARIYSPWLHLPHLPPGRHEITVSLNANGHEALTHNGQPITSTVVVEVPE